jgi:hypothetical protein
MDGDIFAISFTNPLKLTKPAFGWHWDFASEYTPLFTATTGDPATINGDRR